MASPDAGAPPAAAAGASGASASSLFRRVEPGEPVPPPPAELVQWANTTLAATLAGTLYGGVRAHISREPPSLDVHPQASARALRCAAAASDAASWRR
jgi:hypothetical protein